MKRRSYEDSRSILNLSSPSTRQKLLAIPLQAFYDYSLKRLLQEFNIPFTGEHLHVAGNDAHLTLRVLLMIAVSDARRESEVVPAWVPVFEAIARAPLPPMPLKRAQKAAIKRRAKKAAVEQEQVSLWV